MTTVHTLNIDTDYTTTGNSTGTPIDSVGIAFGFGDSNEAHENNFDYIAENVEYTKNQWLDTEAKKYFNKSLTNEQIDKFANNLPEYDQALTEYKKTFEDVNQCEYDDKNEAQNELIKALEKAEGDLYDELYDLWLNGDYREDGLLTKANRYFNDYNITIECGDQGNVLALIESDTLKLLIDDGQLDDDATEADAIGWIESTIDYKTHCTYDDKQAQNAKRKAERERVTAYKAEQKQKADERKKAELLALKK